MSKLAAFFKGSDTRFGIFYPTDYLVAAFRDFSEASKARDALINSGVQEQDLIAVRGEEVVEFAEEHLQKDGLGSMLMTQLSRAIHTEASYADKDLALARQGAAFVAVHCPTEATKTAVWKSLESSQPIVARYYLSTGIEHLAGEV